MTTRRLFVERAAGLVTGACGFASLSPQMTLGQSSDPASDATACYRDNDTECAVEVWEEVYEDQEYDDDVGEAYVTALITHAMRSLDQGDLRTANSALRAAKDIVSNHPFYAYFDEALSAFESVIWVSDMRNRPFAPQDDNFMESRYVEVDNVIGAESWTFAMTEKEPNYFGYYFLGAEREIRRSVSVRTLIQPMSANGSVVVLFGIQDNADFFMVKLGWTGADSIEWSIDRATSGGISYYGGGDHLLLNTDQWHLVEVRMHGSQFELWIDTTLVGTEVIVDYEVGDVGIGVGLNPFEQGSTFTCLFGDTVVYD